MAQILSMVRNKYAMLLHQDIQQSHEIQQTERRGDAIVSLNGQKRILHSREIILCRLFFIGLKGFLASNTL